MRTRLAALAAAVELLAVRQRAGVVNLQREGRGPAAWGARGPAAAYATVGCATVVQGAAEAACNRPFAHHHRLPLLRERRLVALLDGLDVNLGAAADSPGSATRLAGKIAAPPR